ncbi:Metal-dependent hydrolase, endonuclease/exonuclease/phosphatase family [Nannocystis exedens]|uniref:Metal-dependent hydrolase, endonuclease/exonuclease/phosphatase family n=2 Tax=Nannocystis exedens TaxID=54 RepID=A0A1I2GW18_9BACT|nr:endonuclease [Nannocystis exedens]SFF21428.1 Metal-dependent hydrolase, endonuclease/exonuclease/phosphatase family [Nannocystis exedens]
MTYNIRHGRGADRKVDLGRIAEVIASAAPDVVALQEVDVGRARSGGEDQAEALARRLNLTQLRFAPCITHGAEEFYGIATLSRLPIVGARHLLLPGDGRPRSEPRSALSTRLAFGPGEVELVNTHLSLRGSERSAQARALVEAFGQRDLVVVGDLNCTPYGGCYRRLVAHLPRAARRVLTWPARLPILQLDHVLYRGHLEVTEARAIATALARRASDHLPIAAAFAYRAAPEVEALVEVAATAEGQGG